MITMLETTPFVERYQLYNWVENGRAVTTNGVLTIFSTAPPHLDSLVTNNALQLSWPSDHRGWMLQVQTNDLLTGLGTTGFPSPLPQRTPCSPRRSTPPTAASSTG